MCPYFSSSALHVLPTLFWWFVSDRITAFFFVGCCFSAMNHCRLFNAKSSLYIYIKDKCFVSYLLLVYLLLNGLVWFYGMSTIVGYLMPNLFLYIWIVLFRTIQFSISTKYSSIWPIDRYLQTRVDLITVAIKGYSTFPSAPFLEFYDQIV